MTEPASNRKRLRWILVCFLVVILVMGGIAFFQYRDVRLVISKETTLATGPLNDHQQVDFLRAFEDIHYSDKIATEENGFRLIVEQVDLSSKFKEPEELERLCQKLGLKSELIKPSLTYVDPSVEIRQYVESEAFDKKFVLELEASQKNEPQSNKNGEPLANNSAERESTKEEPKDVVLEDYRAISLLNARSSVPWTPADLPMLATWVTENNAVLDLYATALRKPAFELPYVKPKDDVLLLQAMYYTTELRGVARGYLTRANYFLGNGEVRKAIDDIISCKRLGRFVRNRGSVLDRVLGIALENIANSIGLVDPKNEKTTKEDLDYIYQELHALPPVIDRNRSFLFEKYMLMDLMTHVATKQESEFLAEEYQQLRNLGIDWNLVFRQFHEYVDEYCSDPELGLRWRNKLELEPKWIDYISRKTRSLKFAKYMADHVGQVWIEAERRAQCSDNLKTISLAMLRYEKDKGHLPPAYTVDAKGNRLHSWRVLLLPYLGQQELFDQLRLDEPWNSKHNLQFARKCPAIFACPSCELCGQGKSNYTVILGKDLPFETETGKPFEDFGPDSNDLILVAERLIPVAWMDPIRELTVDEAEEGINTSIATIERPPIGSEHPGGIQVGFRDGSAGFISESSEMDDFKNLLRGTNRQFEYF